MIGILAMPGVSHSIAYNLMRMGCPKVMVTLVLLLGWCDFGVEGPYAFFEVFSGKGAATRVWHRAGYQCASFDFEYSKKGMNFLGHAGFALSILTVMKLMPNGVVLLAPQCSSWVVASRGTSRRSFINPMGFEGYKFVTDGNQMIARLVLLLMVVIAKCGIYVIENPAGTLLWQHERFQYFCNKMAWVYTISFWMAHFGSPTPKRTTVMSNSKFVGMLHMGPFSRSKCKKSSTTRQYRDRQGRKRFVGTSKLKASQVYPAGFGTRLLDVYKKANHEEIRRDLRKCYAVDPKLSDRENFVAYPIGDLWLDANVLDVIVYIRKYKGLTIPDSWLAAIDNFIADALRTLDDSPE